MTFDAGVIKRQRYSPPAPFSIVGGSSIGTYSAGSTSTYVYHTFPTSGVFTVTSSVSQTADVLVIAGGGGGSSSNSSGNNNGGGAGGFVATTVQLTPASTYVVTIGAGGAGGVSGGVESGGTGTNSSILVANSNYGSTLFGNAYLLTTSTTVNHQLDVNNFTVETWIYPKFQPSLTTSTRYAQIVQRSGPTQATQIIGWGLYIAGPFLSAATSTPRIAFITTLDGVSTQTYQSSVVSLSTTSWSHIAVSKIGTSLSFYLNGISIGTSTIASNIFPITSAAGYVGIGGHVNKRDTTKYNYYGYISNLRVVKGVGVYTGNFTPSTTPLAVTQSTGTNISAISTGTYTILLAAQTYNIAAPTTFLDNSLYAYTLSTDTTPSIGVRALVANPFSNSLRPPVAQGGGGGQGNISDPTGGSGGGQVITGNGSEIFNGFLGEGNAGGVSTTYGGNGGGGAGGPGAVNGSISLNQAGAGGAGAISSITGVATYYAGGGGGGSIYQFGTNTYTYPPGAGGVGGGGQGSGYTLAQSGWPAYSGTANTGGGGGGNWDSGLSTGTNAGYGGSGIVIVRYQIPNTQRPDPYFKNTTLLINNTALQPNIEDVSTVSSVLTVAGNPLARTLNPYAVNYSVAFDGSTSYLRVPSNANAAFGTSDFTIESWVYVTGTTGTYRTVYSTRPTSSTGGVFTGGAFGVNPTGGLYWYTGGFSFNNTDDLSLTESWNHVAVVRQSGNINVFLNGSALINQANSVGVQYLSVAGGGGGASSAWTTQYGGGGGAGGFLTGSANLNFNTPYVVTVGAGGAGGVKSADGTLSYTGANGGDSSISGQGFSITSVGGGKGGGGGSSNLSAYKYPSVGGSGGGAGSDASTTAYGSSTAGAAGTSGQGNSGGGSRNSNGGGLNGGGGGGGAGSAGAKAPGGTSGAGAGGAGLANPIVGSTVGQLATGTYYLAGGGGGAPASSSAPAALGGLGGGGNGPLTGSGGSAGSFATGGGGGAGFGTYTNPEKYSPGNAGGSGVVIFSHANTYPQATVTGNPTITTTGSNILYTFTASGSITFLSSTATTADNLTLSTATIGANFDLSEKFNGYISNLRVVKDQALFTGTFNVSSGPLGIAPLVNHTGAGVATTTTGTVILMTAADNRLKDKSLSNLAVTGTAVVSNFQPFPVPYNPNGSTYFNGTTDYLIITTASSTISSLNLAGVTWTIECWVNPTGNYTTYNTLWAKRGGNPQQTAYEGFLNTGNGYIGYYNGGTIYTSATVLSSNAWSHCAWVCVGTTVTIYVNGINVYSVTIAANVDYTQPLVIGGYQNATGTIQDFTFGYISDFRIVKGTAVYTANFTPPTGPLTAISNTVLLTLQTNVAATNKVFNDVTRNTWNITPAGSVTQGTVNPFGSGWSGYFNGSTDYLTIPSSTSFGYGTGDFTIELWGYFTTISSSTPNLIDQRSGVTAQVVPTLYLNNGVLSYYVNGAIVWTGATLSANIWYHIALCRSDRLTRIFVNGVQSGATYTDTNNYIISPIRVFASYDASTVVYQAGYCSNLRIVNGTAVYTTNFTPPTSDLPRIKNTVLLTLQSNRFRDNSLYGFGITRVGSTSIQRLSPVVSPVYNPLVNAGSTYFNGTTDYLEIAHNANQLIGTGDFTIEAWCYITSFTLQNPVLSKGDATATTSGVGSFFFGFTTAGVLQFDISGTVVVTGGTSTLNSWNHVAVTRSSGTIYLWLNGVLAASAAVATSINYAAVMRVGRGRGTSANYFAGYMSNLRFVPGTALYPGGNVPSIAMNYLVVAGGGGGGYAFGGGSFTGGGGGAGGLIQSIGQLVYGSTYAIIVGAGAPSFAPPTTYQDGLNGNDSSFYNKIAKGGGGGAGANTYGAAGGSGGGAGHVFDYTLSTGGLALQPTSASGGYGNAGGSVPASSGSQYGGAGGGGAGGPGSDADITNIYLPGGAGGIGVLSSISGTYKYYAGGGGGSTTYYQNGQGGAGGAGGGGAGGASVNISSGAAAAIGVDGTAYTGGGGGAGNDSTLYGNGRAGGGGSGVVIISHNSAVGTATVTGNPTITTTGSNIVYTFTASGSITLGSSSFTVPKSPVPAIPGSILLLNSTDAAIKDQTGKNNLVLVGDTKLRPITKYSSRSIYFDGVGDYITVPASPSLDMGTGDFTIEFWMNLATVPTSGYYTPISQYNGVTAGVGYWSIQLNFAVFSSSVTLALYYDGATGISPSLPTTLVANTWYHIAAARSSGTITFYFNGIPLSTVSYSGKFGSSAVPLYIGEQQSGNAGQMNGYLDNIRITKGVARYLGVFTPPYASYPIR